MIAPPLKLKMALETFSDVPVPVLMVPPGSRAKFPPMFSVTPAPMVMLPLLCK